MTGLGDFLVGSLLAALGGLALALSLLRHRRVDPLLASFGAFALLYGVRQFFESDLIAALGVTELAAAWVVNLVTYLIQIPAWYFFWRLLGSGWRSLVLWWLRVMTVFALVGVASDLIQGMPGTLARHPNNLLVLVGMLIAFVSVLQYRGRMTTDLRVLVTGLSVFGLLVINDNLVSMELLPWSWREESVGFLLFVACLGWIAARRFFATERELTAVEAELEAARRIQASILPDGPPAIGGLSIAVRFQPTSAVAGDFYDFLIQGPDRLGVVVADVSGHGVPAALIASMVKVAVTSRRDEAHQPARLLSEVNRTLCGSFQHGFVTAAYVDLDAGAGRLTAASAGHPLPLRRRAVDGSVGGLGGRGPLLGRFPSAAYQEEGLALEPGDRLVLYTDGIVEARGADGELFGQDRLERLIADGGALSPEAFCDRLWEELRRWSGGGDGSLSGDDLTLVVVDYQGPPMR